MNLNRSWERTSHTMNGSFMDIKDDQGFPDPVVVGSLPMVPSKDVDDL